MKKPVAFISILSVLAGSLALFAQSPRAGTILEKLRPNAQKVRANQPWRNGAPGPVRPKDYTRKSEGIDFTRKVLGTVQYDTGTADSFRTGGAAEHVGNRFNTAKTGPLQVGNITGITWYPNGNTLGSGLMTVFGPLNTMGTAAPQIATFAPTGVVNATFNTIAVNVAVPTSFLVGWYVPGATSLGSLGMVTDTTMGQGHHAMSIDFFGTGFNAIAGENAMLRVTGDVLVPVELIGFTID